MATLTLGEQREAVLLYESGLSMQQVADRLSIHHGAVLYTLRKHSVPRRTTAESNRLRFEAEPLSYDLKPDLTREEERLRLAAVMLYWAEGYKTGSSIDFANSDPAMAFIFKRFLTEICRVDANRIRASLYCYEGQDIEELHEFWSELLAIPRSQFQKPYIKKAVIPSPRGPRMIHGLVHVRYCDTKLLRQMLVWIDKYQLECVGGGVVNRDWL